MFYNRIKERLGVRATLAAAAALMIVGIIAGGAVAQRAIVQFSDVPPGHTAAQSAPWAYDNGITRGCTTDDGFRFCPEDPLNRGHAVTFLYRYHENVVADELADIARLRQQVTDLRADVDNLRGTTAPTTSVKGTTPTTTAPGGGFVIVPTTTTRPPYKLLLNGDEDDTLGYPRSGRIPAGSYKAEFSLEATEAASNHDDDGDVNTNDAVKLIRVEYSNDRIRWLTYAVSSLKLENGNLPAAGPLLLRSSSQDNVSVEDAIGDLPTRGYIRVRAYLDDDSPASTNLTTKYDFRWSLVLTEKK